MVRITNGQRVTVVTKGAFKELYQPSGWQICDLSNENTSAEEVIEEVVNSAENAPEAANLGTSDIEDDPEEEGTEEFEIPISEMKLDELKAFALKHDIDISAAKTKQDIKAIIKAEMEA